MLASDQRASAGWLVAVGLAAVGVVVAVLVLPVQAWTIELVTYIRDAGWAAVVLFVVVYIAAAILGVPGSVLTFGAGFAYGPLWGTVLVSPASILAAIAAFAIARRYARAPFARRFEGDRKFAAIDRAIARDGWRLTVLLRLSPIVPYSLLNYMLGLTSIRFRDYAHASAIGMLPGTIAYVYVGSLVTTTTQLAARPDSAWTTALYCVGLVAAVVAMIVVTRLARRALARELADEPAVVHDPDLAAGEPCPWPEPALPRAITPAGTR